MTSFVHLEYSNQHGGVERVASALASAQHIKRNLSSTRTLAALLLSAVVAAVMVVAYQVMDTVAEGHLLALWIAMWLAAFAALALFASTASHVAKSIKNSLDSWSRKAAAQRADERLWVIAKTDPRVMADLQMVLSRGSDENLKFVAPASRVGKLSPNAVASNGAPLAPYQRLYI